MGWVPFRPPPSCADARGVFTNLERDKNGTTVKRNVFAFTTNSNGQTVPKKTSTTSYWLGEGAPSSFKLPKPRVTVECRNCGAPVAPAEHRCSYCTSIPER